MFELPGGLYGFMLPPQYINKVKFIIIEFSDLKKYNSTSFLCNIYTYKVVSSVCLFVCICPHNLETIFADLPKMYTMELASLA